MTSTTRDLTLADIKTYLDNDVFKGKTCGVSAATNTKSKITDVDTFLLAQVENTTNYNTSSITKDNFLELYNEQYSRNLEAFIGILIVGAILAKMMIFPTKV